MAASYGGHESTSVPVKWHLIASNGFSRMHECDRHTDIETDGPRYGTRVAIGSIIAFSGGAA